MHRIALKIDVDTWRGTREGAPALAKLLERLDVQATFLFSLGPDHTGRAIRRVFRPGFLGKVRRTSVVSHYGWQTLLYGTLLPGPDIGVREAGTMRAIEAAGFAAGVHAWDHVAWQDGLETADAQWTQDQMRRANERFVDIFHHLPVVHGAAGWQMNAAAFRCEAELGYTVGSDSRGYSPFVPVNEANEAIGLTQFPTTLPTMDELLGTLDCDASNVHEKILALTEPRVPLHVYTLHAEIEGGSLMPAFERLLGGWRRQGYSFVPMSELPAIFHGARLPRCMPMRGTVPGRSGTLSVQCSEAEQTGEI